MPKQKLFWFAVSIILATFLIHRFIIVPSNQKFTQENPVESARLAIGTLIHERGSGFVKGKYYNTGQLDIVYAFFPPKLKPGEQLDEAISIKIAPLFKKLFEDNPNIQNITFLVCLPFTKDGTRAWAWQLDTTQEKIYWEPSFFVELSRQKFHEINWTTFDKSEFTAYAADNGLFLTVYPEIYQQHPELNRFKEISN